MPKAEKNMVTLNSQDPSTEDYCKNFKRGFHQAHLIPLQGTFVQATTCSTLLSSPMKADERISKMKPELCLGFSNLEAIVGFAKSYRTKVELL